MILQIVSVGPGDSGFLNSKTVEALRNAGLLVLRTGRHPLTSWLADQGIPFRTMDSIYESAEDFESLSSAVAEEIWNLAAEHSNTVYAVSDMMTDHTVDAVFAGKPADGRINILPGFSFSDYYLPACRDFFSVSDIRICPASSFVNSGYDPSRPLLLTELNDELTAGDVKNYLSSFIRDEETVLFFEKDATVRPVRLYELDRQPFYNHLSAVAAGADSYEQRNRRTLDDLISIMDRLRSPDGCSWDRAQTHESLQPYVVEEAWEVVDAIHDGQPVHLAEELGDLLFQVVFHESIGRSFDEFVMDDILGTICEKMIRRHPHVFMKNEIRSANRRGTGSSRKREDPEVLLKCLTPFHQGFRPFVTRKRYFAGWSRCRISRYHPSKRSLHPYKKPQTTSEMPAACRKVKSTSERSFFCAPYFPES